MTASVSGFSIIQGMASALDTMLPSAWTSTQPHLVGLWCQRMGKVAILFRKKSAASYYSLTAVVMAVTTIVSSLASSL